MDYRTELKRKAVHYAAAIFPLLYLAVPSRGWMLWLLGILASAAIAVEVARARNPALNERLLAFFGGIHRPSEVNRLSAFPFTFTGAFLTVLLFPKEAAILAMLMFVFGDGSAALVGRRWAGLRIGNRSLAGSAANFLTCLLIGWAFQAWIHPVGWTGILAGAAAATLAEFTPRPLNDNLTMPIAAGAAIHLAGRIL